ncbi:flagellin [Vibrio alginolyticus]|uniref:flagellin n=1 Tax=Vibrio alginolyticus TaxID=663 RepID=UPI003D7E75EB
MGVKIHDNKFTFNINGLKNVYFTEKEKSISHGQPYEGVYSSGTDVIVKAGRHKTKEVSQWFMDKTNGGGVIAKTFHDHHPEELNFAVSGSLELIFENGESFVIDNFVLAQGSNLTHNNWWIGSKDMIGVTWGKVDENYTEKLVKDTLNLVKDIALEKPAGVIKDSAHLILGVLKSNKVGSGSIAARNINNSKSVDLFLFQMGNKDTDSTNTGRYTAKDS